jgi:hypothetical protein
MIRKLYREKFWWVVFAGTLMHFRFRMARFSGKHRCCILLLAGVLAGTAHAQSFELNTDDWVRPRSGATVAGFEALRQAVEAWSASGGNGAIEIRYPGGEEGGLWARELTDWLVAFGVPSRHVRALPGSGRRDRIILEVMKAEGINPQMDADLRR